MARSRRILGADPGGTTGLALFVGPDLEWTGEAPNAMEGMIEFIRSGELPDFDAIVLESFIVEPDFVGRAHASEVIGVLVAHARSIGAEVWFQSRSQKALVKRGTEAERFRWLRSMGYVGSSHVLDAITHALLRLRREKNRDVVQRHWP